MTDLLSRIPADRREKIIDRAEELIREERERRGRCAPDSNQHAAAPSALFRYLQGMAMGCLAGLLVGYVLGLIIPPRHDACQVRASSAHLSVCLDGQLAKLKELRR